MLLMLFLEYLPLLFLIGDILTIDQSLKILMLLAADQTSHRCMEMGTHS